MLSLIFALLTAASPGVDAGLRLVKPVDVELRDISGDNSVGEAERDLPRRLVVQVKDSTGTPRRNVAVRFRVLSEPVENRLNGCAARLADTLVLTNAEGLAATAFRFGRALGEYHIEARLGETALTYALTARARNWLLSLIFGLLGGLSFFLFGLYYGSKGLKRLAGNRLRDLVFNLTRHRPLSLVVGIVVTVIFQSSSATTALLISFATSGLVTLTQALGVILGADIGTTLTVQLLAFRVLDYAVTLTAIGFIVMYASRRFKDFGQVVFGFGLVFFSLKIVADATAPLKLDPNFPRILESLGNAPVWGTLIAAFFTFLIRSSAATVGIAVGLAVSGLLTLEASIPIILGANVGTAFTAWVASWRGNTEARRIALGHVLFKLIIVLPLLFLIQPLALVVARTAGEVPRQIANAHTLVNVVAALVFLPFLKPYERLLCRLVPPRATDAELRPRYLEPALLEAPAVAVGQATREVLRMGDTVMEMLRDSLPVFLKNDRDGRHRVMALDDQVDQLEKATSSYVTDLTREEMTPLLSQRAVALFHIINELEHIGDIVSKSLMSYVKKKTDDNLSFSAEGLDEIAALHTEVTETLKLALAAVSTWDLPLARATARRRDFGNQRLAELHTRHLKRLQAGLKESIDTSTVHLDIIADLERINYHSAAIGQAIAGPGRPTAQG